MDSDDETLLEFPCDFPIKAMGPHTEEFEGLVVSLVRQHAPDLGEGAVRTQASAKGNYLSVTVTVRATSKAQLDAIYRELTAAEEIVMVL